MDETDDTCDENAANRCFTSADELNVSDPESTQFTVSQDVVDKLAHGVVDSCRPDLITSKKLLSDVTDSQLILIETLQQENAKFAESLALQELTHTMQLAKQYHTKLVNIKKEMHALHEKSAQLKRRALKIQQQKQTEALHAEQRRERELEKERALTARDISKKPSTTTHHR